MALRIAVIGAKGLPSRSGVERVVEPLVQRLAKNHQVTLYCDARYTPPDYTRDDLRLVRVRTVAGKHAQATSLFVQSAVKALYVNQHDVVHMHGVETALVAPFLRLRYPMVATAHGSPLRSTRAKWGPVARTVMGITERPFVYLPEVVTSVSEVDARYFESRYGRRVTYIPNGMEPPAPVTAADKSAVCARLGVAPDDFLLFAAGRIDPTKGCHVFLEALGRMPIHPRALVVGDLNQVPEYAAQLRVMAARLPLSFVDPIKDRAELMAVISACSAFVFPSLTEGMSMMLLEAAACGAPLVCSDIPENRCVLGDRTLYFRSGDAADLAGRLMWAVEHGDEMARLSAAACDWVLSTYRWDRIVLMYEQAYETAIRRRGRRPHAYTA